MAYISQTGSLVLFAKALNGTLIQGHTQLLCNTSCYEFLHYYELLM